VYNPKRSYSHHDVYLYPASEGGGGLGEAVSDDKYAYLRSRKMSSKCNLELRILDSVTEPFTLRARLDVLHSLFDALSTQPTKVHVHVYIYIFLCIYKYTCLYV
jgi:hypothetical protein